MRSYLGSQISLHHSGNVTRNYHTDRSGQVLYVFNDFGFRSTGREFLGDIQIWVVGCSITFGTGLKIEDTWPNRLARILSSKLERSVGLRNFSQGGASNDYISRTAWEQIASGTPDLILVQTTYPDRSEYINRVVNGELIGRWNPKPISDAYFQFYTDEIGWTNLARNMALLYATFDKCGTRYAFLPTSYPLDDNGNYICSSIPQVFFDSFSQENLFVCNIWEEPHFVDLAHDCLHPGPISNLLFANQLSSYLLNNGFLK